MMMVAAFLLISVIVIPSKASAEVVNEDALETGYLNVKSPIVLEFDTPVQWNPDFYPSEPSQSLVDHPGLTLAVDESDGQLVAIKMEIDTDNPRKLIITPDQGEPWKSNRYYKLSITEPILLDSSDNKLFTDDEYYDFGTYTLSFSQLMFGEKINNQESKTPEIDNLITNFTPRNIKVTAPLRYMNLS